jgi:glycerophosphoryl diester phosphodiesterase
LHVFSHPRGHRIVTARLQAGDVRAARVVDPAAMAALPPLYAHRLGRDGGPDNSRAALRRTLSEPVDGLETDVCLTADGRAVLLHEPWLSTATDLDGWAHQTPWSRLRHARLRDRAGVCGDETPMLLEELLDATPAGLVLQLDVKAHGDPALARATSAAIARVVAAAGPEAEVGGRPRVEVLSFHSAACEEAAAHGLRARLVTWADYAPGALVRWARRAGVDGVCIEHFLLHPALVVRLRAGGLSVSTGTIDDACIARRAADLGVDAITSDRPAALRRELAAQQAAA